MYRVIFTLMDGTTRHTDPMPLNAAIEALAEQAKAISNTGGFTEAKLQKAD